VVKDRLGIGQTMASPWLALLPRLNSLRLRQGYGHARLAAAGRWSDSLYAEQRTFDRRIWSASEPGEGAPEVAAIVMENQSGSGIGVMRLSWRRRRSPRVAGITDASTAIRSSGIDYR
jgi:hypothetical protein